MGENNSVFNFLAVLTFTTVFTISIAFAIPVETSYHTIYTSSGVDCNITMEQVPDANKSVVCNQDYYPRNMSVSQTTLGDYILEKYGAEDVTDSFNTGDYFLSAGK